MLLGYLQSNKPHVHVGDLVNNNCIQIKHDTLLLFFIKYELRSSYLLWGPLYIN